MRDIRADLVERLANVEAERKTIADRLEALGHQDQALRALIQQEDATWNSQRKLELVAVGTADQGDLKERTELGRLLIHALGDGEPRSLEYLKEAVMMRGFDFEGKQPGRVIHFALLGMAQTGIVEMVEKGIWRLLDAIRTSDSKVDGPPLKARPVANGSNGKGRKDQLAEFIATHGPAKRSDLVKNAGMPQGTVNASLNDKTMFVQISGGRWDLVRRPN